MKFSSRLSTDSRSSVPRRFAPRRATRGRNSYEETGSSHFQESQTAEEAEEDAYAVDDPEEQGSGDGIVEEYAEQSRTTASNPYTESETAANTPESVHSSNTVAAMADYPNTQSTQTPQYGAYVNIAPLPMFRAEPGECPVSHLSRFARVCRANNALSADMMTRIFPVTLDGEAALWYELNVEPYPSLPWEEIKSSFLQMHSRTESVDQLRSALMMMQQQDGESVNGFYLRMQRLLRKWPNHGIPDVIVRGVFVDGLKEDYQDWIVPNKPHSLEDALRLALAWEQAQSIRAATRTRNAPKCGFCEGGHEEQMCQIRQKMKELWMKSKEKQSIALPNFAAEKKYRSLSTTTSMTRRQGEDVKEGEVEVNGQKSQCQCGKHHCWKKNAITKSTSLIARNSTAD